MFFCDFFLEDIPLISRSVEINITGFSDWGLGSLTQSPVPSTLSRQLVFNGSLATYQFSLIF
jgi:hypothetical protein